MIVKDSKRSIDVNGYMEIKDCVLTEVGISEYLGFEIPRHEELGLDSNEIYKVYRPLDVLEKNVDTFNNVPLTLEHPEDLSSENFQEVITYGATGEKSRIEDNKLLNNIIIYDKKLIEMIENDEISDLSCGYFWDVKKVDNEEYDFIIIDIKGNHVAIVENPRIENAKIADSKKIPGDIMKNITNWFSKDSEIKDSFEDFKAEMEALIDKYDLKEKIEIEFKEKLEDSIEIEEVKEEEIEDQEVASDEHAIETYSKEEIDRMFASLKAQDDEKIEAIEEAKEILGDVDLKANDSDSIRRLILDAKGVSHKSMDHSALKGAVSALKSISKTSPQVVVDSGFSSFSEDLIKKLGVK